MIKVKVSKDQIVISGHALYSEYGKDIVCASASSIVITTINAILRIDKEAIEYIEEKDKLTIKIKSNDKIINIIIENMIAMLKELATTYKKNVKVDEEEQK